MLEWWQMLIVILFPMLAVAIVSTYYRDDHGLDANGFPEDLEESHEQIDGYA